MKRILSISIIIVSIVFSSCDSEEKKADAPDTLQKTSGVVVRVDYYIVNNLEPGDSKTVKITGAASGVSAKSHVVKLKSNELTGGETILVGTSFVPH